VRTIQELVDSGKMAPAGQRLESALAPPPAGLGRAVRGGDWRIARCSSRRWTRRRWMRSSPATRRATHTRGGAERYGTEPGTCEESAATGLPQVTVPAGYMGGRYPVGVSFLGRMWTDRQLLGLAYAYEQTTHHRRPPTTVR
jgi:hypothetical protein